MDFSKDKTQTSLNISQEVVSAIAQNAIKEIAGVYSLSAIPSKLSAFSSAVHSVKIALSSDAAQIDIAIMVDVNYRIKEVCEQAQAAIKDAVQNMTGIAVSKVNIFVTGVHIPAAE